MRAWGPLLQWTAAAALSLAAMLLLAEISYRFYVLDFYAPELRAYNLVQSVDSLPAAADILVMGDSYSAGKSSYVASLREMLPDCAIVNGAIPGSGLPEANVVAPSLFRRFQPRVFIYQVYAGNDLINIRNPLNFSTISPGRNLYWMLSDRLRVLGFINYRLGQMAAGSAGIPGSTEPGSLHGPFSPDKYASTTKNYLRADPRVIEKQIALQGDRAPDFERFIRLMDDLLAGCNASNCQAYLLIIPHAVQVAQKYYYDMVELGADFHSSSGAMMDASYPFAAKIRERYGNQKEVRVVNLVEDLQEAEADGIDVYFRNDPHLTPAGQEIVAARMAKELRTANLNCTGLKTSTLHPR